MGAARQAAEAVTGALEDHDIERARSWLAENFTFHDPSSPLGPISADQWLQMNAGLHRAFPDFRYNFLITREEGNQVWVSTRMQGTHSGDWDLSAMGMGVVPATGREVSTGKSTTRGIVNDNGKIEKIEVVEQEAGAGPMGMLQQLGVDIG